jgi:hypothetical protein
VTSDGVLRLVRQALDSGRADDPIAQTQGRLLPPLRIQHPDGGTWGWMVAVEIDDRLAGLAQVTDAGEFHRYAAFRRQAVASDPLPAAATWADPAAVRRRASTLASANDQLSEPVLTYDRSPDRLCWAGDGDSARWPAAHDRGRR